MSDDTFSIGQDYVVAVCIATEVPPTPTAAFSTDMIRLARRAVCDVIRNRVAAGSFGETAVEVVLAPRQFSAVCREEYWRRAMAGRWFPRHVASCLVAWQQPQPPLVPDALWYYSPISMEPKGATPLWLEGKVEVVVPNLNSDYFRFFKEA